MGLGVSLAFIAIGSILAFATRFTLTGIDIRMVGWILLLIGLANMAFTLMYTRPRRRAQIAEVDEEPVYVVHPDEPTPHVHADEPAPHIHPRTEPTEAMHPAPQPVPPHERPEQAPHVRHTTRRNLGS